MHSFAFLTGYCFIGRYPLKTDSAAKTISHWMLMDSHPLEALTLWFKSQPYQFRQYIAHMYWYCSSESIDNIFLDPEDYINKFLHHILNPDFPLRLLSRLVIIRSVLDFIIDNHKPLAKLPGEPYCPYDIDTSGRVLDFADTRWEMVLVSWRELRVNALSDQVIRAWIDNISRK